MPEDRSPEQPPTIVHSGRIFSVEVVRRTDADGNVLVRDVVRHCGAVAIVPVLDDEHVVMIRNFRIAVDERLWEFPAGGLEPDEDPTRAAARELEEETGYRAGRLDPLGLMYTSPGFADERMHMYVAHDLEPVGQRLEPGEDIEVHTVRVDDLHRMIDDNSIRDGKTIVAALRWQRSLRGATGG